MSLLWILSTSSTGAWKYSLLVWPCLSLRGELVGCPALAGRDAGSYAKQAEKEQMVCALSGATVQLLLQRPAVWRYSWMLSCCVVQRAEDMYFLNLQMIYLHSRKPHYVTVTQLTLYKLCLVPTQSMVQALLHKGKGRLRPPCLASVSTDMSVFMGWFTNILTAALCVCAVNKDHCSINSWFCCCSQVDFSRIQCQTCSPV